jgi:hypothetical protein
VTIGYFFFPAVFRELLRDDLRGTFPPFSRASLSPIAIACLRLVTLRPDPLFNVPFFLRRIVDSTCFAADLPYLAIRPSEAPSANPVLNAAFKRAELTEKTEGRKGLTD